MTRIYMCVCVCVRQKGYDPKKRDATTRIRNFNDPDDFISHLTRELKQIAVPIAPEELITSR